MAIKDPEQFFGGQNCDKGETTIPSGERTSSDSINQSEESQTSARNKKIMAKEIISANASQVEAEEQFLGGGNCGKKNAEGTGSAEVINIKKKGDLWEKN